MTIIDCNTCPARGHHCNQCFVPVVAGAWLSQGHDPGRPINETNETPVATHRGADPGPRSASSAGLALTDAEWEAVDTFIGAGLVNPLDVLDLLASSDSAVRGSWLQVG
ncbi:MAG: hypothetical protein WBG36_06435 [Ornithinimicrobium sp.]